MWQAIDAFVKDNLVPGGQRSGRTDMALGIAGLFGCAAAIIFDIVAVRVAEDHTFLGTTVSTLAGGEGGWIMDLGITGFAVGMLAVAAGLWRWPGDGLRWHLGAIVLALSAAGLLIMAYYDAYAQEVTDAIVIHDPLVAITGLAFSLTLALLAPHMGNLRHGFGYASVGLLVLWLLPWPGVWLAPDSIAGAVERIAGLAMIAWLALASWFMIQKGRGTLPE